MFKRTFNSILTVILIIGLIAGFVYWTGRTAGKTYQERVNNEQNTELDVYKMQKYAVDNTEKVLEALVAGDSDEIAELVPRATNVKELMEYADWENLDLDKKTSFGTGSFMPKPDKNGKMDVGELITLKTQNGKYVMYVQTVTSRYGIIDDGVSCIAVAKWKHYDDTDYSWDWKTDSETLRVGKAFY